MRPVVLLAAAALLVAAAVIGADAFVGGRVEREAAAALRADLERRTGAPPREVDVSLEGALAGLRSVTGPAPDATATADGIALPATQGRLTRVRVALSGIDVEIGEALGGAGEGMPFSAASGTFRAVLSEEDLNGILGGEDSSFELFDIREDVILAGPPGQDAAAAAGVAARDGFPFTADVGMEGERHLLILRRADGAGPGGVLAEATLTIPFVLPQGFRLETLETQEDRLVGSGRVDVERLTAAPGDAAG